MTSLNKFPNNNLDNLDNGIPNKIPNKISNGIPNKIPSEPEKEPTCFELIKQITNSVLKFVNDFDDMKEYLVNCLKYQSEYYKYMNRQNERKYF